MAGLPLEGIRIVDVTVVWAGPYVTQLLAEWGAEVIRVEPITRVQPATRGADRLTSKEQQISIADQGIAAGGGFPGHEPGADPWNRNSGFNSHARNKLSATADIMSDEGRDLFLRIVEQADVVIENNVPETIEKAHITYEELRQVNEQIIMLRIPAFGLSGPYKNYRALGTHIEGMIGHHHIRGYPDGTPEEAGDVFTGDAVAGIQGAFAVMMALRHRHRKGVGQQIELSQAENFLPILGEQILDWTMNQHDAGPQGNQHPSHAPHQAYPCSGDDEWIAIDVGSDAEFVALCGVLGTDALTSDERFVTAEARWQHRDELDPLIADATRGREKLPLFHALQAEGVAAGPLHNAAERFEDAQLLHRNMFEELENESVGRQRYVRPLWLMERTPNPLRRAPVTIGQDNEYVYREVVGMDEAEYASHVASGQIGDTYSSDVLP